MYNITLVILKAALDPALDDIYFSPQVDSRVTLQLIIGIFNDHQKFIEYFHGMANLTSFTIPSAATSMMRFDLY